MLVIYVNVGGGASGDQCRCRRTRAPKTYHDEVCVRRGWFKRVHPVRGHTYIYNTFVVHTLNAILFRLFTVIWAVNMSPKAGLTAEYTW